MSYQTGPKTHVPLPAQELALLYLQLGKLIDAGVPIQDILEQLAKLDSVCGQRAKVALGYLKRGQSLSNAGIKAGLFVDLDAELMKVADWGGFHTQICDQLHQLYEEKVRYIRRLKSRLFLPLFVFLLSLFIQPLPELISGTISLGGYLLSIVSLIGTLALIFFLLWRLPSWSRRGALQALGVDRLIDSLRLHIPYFGYWYKRRQLRYFIQALGLMMQAGVPLFDALVKATKLTENTVLRKRVRKIGSYLHQNPNLLMAFSQAGGFEPSVLQLLATGEQSGSLADMLLHAAKLESQEIALHDDNLIARLPRLIYFLVVLWVAFGLV